MSYWTRTEEMKAAGQVPNCPHCGQKMVAEDDHGRFTCFCSGYRSAEFQPMSIPQLEKDLPDEGKSKVPGINRLHLPPTQAEQAFFKVMMGGPDAISSPAYIEAVAAMEEERKDPGDRDEG